MRFLYTFLMASAAFLSNVSSTTVWAGDSEAQKKELIGTLSVSDLLIQPRLLVTEDDTNSFELDRSYFFFSWKVNNQLSAHFGVGRHDLVNHNTRLNVNSNNITSFDDFAFFEAYGQLDSKFGTIRAGLIPLMFGWEGVHRESEWIFPRTLFYGGEDPSGTYAGQNFGLRDQGVSYFVSYKNFYTQAALHNGENGKDLDGKIWHTAVVGWKNNSGLEGAISMSNGKYKNGNTDPELDFSYGNAFFGFHFYDLFLLAEGYIGEEKRSFDPGDGLETRFWDWHVDASHPIVKGIAGLARYEMYDPDTNVANDKTQRYILGVGFSNELRTSNLYVWGIKNKEQGNDLSNDQLMIVWKVRSLSIF